MRSNALLIFFELYRTLLLFFTKKSNLFEFYFFSIPTETLSNELLKIAKKTIKIENKSPKIKE